MAVNVPFQLNLWLPPHMWSIAVFTVSDKGDCVVPEEIPVTEKETVWYLPYGKKDDLGNSVMWDKFTKKISIEKGGK